MACGFLYLVVVMDWFSRRVLAWRLSNTMDAGFCVEALEEALERFGAPEIFNTDQGSQFTGLAFTGTLEAHGVAISMDGRGRWLDNVFVERLWRSLKYEEVYLHAYETPVAARAGIGAWLRFYNEERLHQALEYRTPNAVHAAEARPVDMMDIAAAMTTSPHDLPVGPVQAQDPRRLDPQPLDNEQRRPVPVETHILEKPLQAAIRRRDQRRPGKLAGDVTQIDRAAVDQTQNQQRQRLHTRLAEIKMAR